MKKETLILPKLGLTMTTAVITSVLKNVGDAVREGEPVIEFETNKLTKTIDAPFDGYVAAIMVAEDDDVEVTDPVCVIADEME